MTLAHCNCLISEGTDHEFHECPLPAKWTNERYPEGLFCVEHANAFAWACEQPWVRLQ